MSTPPSLSLGMRLVRRFIFLVCGAIVGVALWLYGPSFLSQKTSSPSPSLTSSELVHLPAPTQSPLSLYGRKDFTPPPPSAKLISCILFGVGEDPELTQKALTLLPSEIIIALSPHTQDVRYWAQQFHQKGHEVLLSVGLEPEGFPLNDPGAHTLLTHLSPQEMSKRLSWALDQVPYAIGVTHETGNLFTVLEKPLRTFFKILHAKQLFFLDTMVSPESQSSQLAPLEDVSLLTVDRPFSLQTLSLEKIRSLREQATQDGRLVMSLPLSPLSLAMIKELPIPSKPIPGKKDAMTPEIVFVPLSFALQNPLT